MTHIVNIVNSIPFDHYTKRQVAQLLNTSPRAIQYLINVGRLYNGERVKLHKSGQFITKENLINYINQIHATTKQTTTR